jgi:hypothetical protein
MSLSAWDFGFSAQHRIYRNLWFGVEVGVSGLRGLTIVGGDLQAPDTRLDNTGYALLTLNLRPGPPSGR